MQRTKAKRPAHFTREHQRMARRKVSSESCARNGAKGAKVTMAKYGEEFLFKKWQKWKLENPSRPELLMIGILSRLGIRYERERQIGESLYSMDFYLPDTNQSIEVNSRIHTQFEAEKRKRRSARKRALLEQLEINCLVVWDTELTADTPAVISKVQSFLKGGQ
jgi:very-short-patch-repair endonuclease